MYNKCLLGNKLLIGVTCSGIMSERTLFWFETEPQGIKPDCYQMVVQRYYQRRIAVQGRLVLVQMIVNHC